jgi:WD40 repeat protein
MTTRQGELRLQVGGTVNPRTGVYIVRPSDDELLRLLERGEYANVLCSRQMGKSSLLVRARARLAEKGYATAAIDVAGYLGSPNDADAWYQGLLDEIAHQLALDVDVTAWWEASRTITPNQRLIQFFRDEVAAKISSPVVIFLDEIDSTLKLPYADDFFVAIRAMYNDRASEPLYEKVTFCLVGVATPNELIKDRRTTPYNIGRTIELQDYDPDHDDLSPLFRAIADDVVKGEAVVSAVLQWTGGHPYLTVRLCDEFVTRRRTVPNEVDELVKETFDNLEALQTDTHFEQALRFLSERVEDKLATLGLYRRLWQGERVRDQAAPSHIALKLSGIVKRDRNGMLTVRNPIYHRVFTDEWAVSAAEADARLREEEFAWRSMAERDEGILRASLGDYRTALGAYQTLRNNPTYMGSADDLWANFLARRGAQRLQRDHAILWSLRALAACPTDERAEAVSKLTDADYKHLALTFHHRNLEAETATTPVTAVAFSPDGEHALSGCTDGTARLWHIATGQSLAPLLRHESAVWAVAFSPDGTRVLTGCANGTAWLWRAETGESVVAPLTHPLLVSSLAFSPDGRYVLTGCYDGMARLWDADTGELLGAPIPHERLVSSVAISPDGGRALVGCYDGAARLWDITTRRPLGAPLRHESSVWAVAFSPDGHRALTGCGGGTIHLWSTATGHPLGAPLARESSVLTVAFSPDGKYLLAGFDDGVACMWLAATGQPLPQRMKHDRTVNSVAFSPDGRLALTGSDDGSVRLWRTEQEPATSQSVKSSGPSQLLKGWERRLGLRINEAGEIVPLRQ